MKSVVMFGAASLILVVGMVTVAIPNAVHADPPPKPLSIYCIDGQSGAGKCADSKAECKLLLVGIYEGHKCIRLK